MLRFKQFNRLKHWAIDTKIGGKRMASKMVIKERGKQKVLREVVGVKPSVGAEIISGESTGRRKRPGGVEITITPKVKPM